MAETDSPIQRYLVRSPEKVVQWLAPDLALAQPIELLPRDLPDKRRQADTIIKAGPEVLHVEFQGYSDPTMAARMCWYSSRIWEQFETEPRQFLVAVHPDAGQQPDEYRSEYRHQVWDAVHLWDTPYELLIDAVPELATLARPSGDDVASLLDTVGRRIMALPSNRQADSLSVACALAESRYDETTVNSHLRRLFMADTGILERSTFMKRYLEKARDEGRDLGREEGRDLGREDGAHAITLRLLTAKIGPLSSRSTTAIQALSFDQTAALSEALLGISSHSDLTAWLERHAEK